MSQKPKPKKQQPWNSFAYLAGLAKKKTSVMVYLNSNTLEEESQLKGVLCETDNWTIAFLTDTGRRLLLFKHSIRYIEEVKAK